MDIYWSRRQIFVSKMPNVWMSVFGRVCVWFICFVFIFTPFLSLLRTVSRLTQIRARDRRGSRNSSPRAYCLKPQEKTNKKKKKPGVKKKKKSRLKQQQILHFFRRYFWRHDVRLAHIFSFRLFMPFCFSSVFRGGVCICMMWTVERVAVWITETKEERGTYKKQHRRHRLPITLTISNAVFFSLLKIRRGCFGSTRSAGIFFRVCTHWVVWFLSTRMSHAHFWKQSCATKSGNDRHTQETRKFRFVHAAQHICTHFNNNNKKWWWWWFYSIFPQREVTLLFNDALSFRYVDAIWQCTIY